MWSFIYQTFHIRILCAKYSENWVIQFGNEVENAKSFQMDRCWTHFDQKSSFQHWLRLAIKVKLAQMNYKGQIKPSCLNKHSTINKTSKTSSSQKGWISNLCFEVKIECKHDIFQKIQNSILCISCC